MRHRHLPVPRWRHRDFEFKLRIDTVIANATGAVSILEPCECEGFPAERDPDSSNNKAPIVVNPSAPPLANTGTKIGLVAALGGLLLIAGAATLALIRRARTVA